MLTHPQKAKMFLPIVLPVFAFLLSINCKISSSTYKRSSKIGHPCQHHENSPAYVPALILANLHRG